MLDSIVTRIYAKWLGEEKRRRYDLEIEISLAANKINAQTTKILDTLQSKGVISFWKIKGNSLAVFTKDK